MTVAADSSPLIALAKIDEFELLQKLFGDVFISSEVFSEVVVAGQGLAGSRETSSAPWIKVHRIAKPADLLAVRLRFSLGVGELSTFVLAKELNADLVLVDDSGARRLMASGGFLIQGTIGILEAGFARKYVADIRQLFARLLTRGVYLDRAFLDSRLKMLGLPTL